MMMLWLVKTMPTKTIGAHTCIHENQLQVQSRKIERLEAHNEFKDERIDELSHNMEKINDKLDKVLDGFSDLKQQSYHDDKDLEARLIRIETELKTNKDLSKSNYNKLSIIMAAVTVCFVILTFYFNFIK